MNEKTEGICHFCEEPCNQDDYCYGCREFICNQCDKRDMELPFEPHDVEKHKRE